MSLAPCLARGCCDQLAGGISKPSGSGPPGVRAPWRWKTWAGRFRQHGVITACASTLILRRNSYFWCVHNQVGSLGVLQVPQE